MTATYDATLDTNADLVRFLIGDTDVTSPIFQDEEINAVLVINPAPIEAAITMANSAAAKFARRASTTIDGLSVQWKEVSENFRSLAANLKQQANDAPGGLGVPSVSGVSLGVMDGVDSNEDRVKSRFTMGQDDIPEGGPVSPDKREQI